MPPSPIAVIDDFDANSRRSLIPHSLRCDRIRRLHCWGIFSQPLASRTTSLGKFLGRRYAFRRCWIRRQLGRFVSETTVSRPFACGAAMGAGCSWVLRLVGLPRLVGLAARGAREAWVR